MLDFKLIKKMEMEGVGLIWDKGRNKNILMKKCIYLSFYNLFTDKFMLIKILMKKCIYFSFYNLFTDKFMLIKTE